MKNNFSNTPIMSYSAKYCSAYYGTVSDRAAHSAPPIRGSKGPIRWDPANAVESDSGSNDGY